MISVIMATYKESEIFLRQSIESILNQTYKNIEFIIILDNPINEMHKRIVKEYADKDERIRFFVNEENLGLSKTLNKGISLANGEYIARMDADDVSLEYRLKKQYQYLVENDYDLIGGITQMIDESDNTIFSIKRIPTDYNKIKKVLRYGQCIAHPTWFGKKEVFEKLNGYRYIPLCEDYDFTLRAVLNGYKISNMNEILIKYRMTKDSVSRSNLYKQYLYMKYITNQYKKDSIANINEANLYVDGNFNDNKARNYLKSNVLFNNMLLYLEQKKYFSFCINGVKLLFSSKAFLNKIYRFFMLTLYS